MTSKRPLRTAFLATAACVLLLTQAAVSAPADLFTTEDGAVSFWAPLPPQKSTKVIPGKAGNYRDTRYAMSAPNYLILTTMLELHGVPTTGDEDSFLEAGVERMKSSLAPDFVLDNVGGKTDLRLGPNGLKGMQIRGTKGDIRVTLRVYVGTCRIYVFQVTHETGDKMTEQLGERYLKSVTIADPVSKSCTASPG